MHKHYANGQLSLIIADKIIVSCTANSDLSNYQQKLLMLLQDGWFLHGEIKVSRGSNNCLMFDQALVKFA